MDNHEDHANIHCVFAIFDEKAQGFLPPWNLPTKAMGLRAFADCVNDPRHAFGKHPHDYTLFLVGYFDDQTAQLIPNKRSMGNGIEFENTSLQDKMQQIAMDESLQEHIEKTQVNTNGGSSEISND